MPQRPRAELAKSDLGLAPLESLNGHDGLQMWMFGSLEKNMRSKMRPAILVAILSVGSQVAWDKVQLGC